MTIDAYPLTWPDGRIRTPSYSRERAKFATTFARARDDVFHEVELLVGRYTVRDAGVVLSTNIALRRDGLPLASQRQPDDPGVALYFMYKKRQVCFACDRWNKIEDNMQAIAKTIDALRGIARWGTGDMVESAFRGYTALPAPGSIATRTWREVMGFAFTPTPQELTAKYRVLRSAAHPDNGGSVQAFDELTKAYEAAQKEIA